MATCKDCLHVKVCDALIKSGCPYLDEEIPADAFCMVFKNKADVVPKSELSIVGVQNMALVNTKEDLQRRLAAVESVASAAIEKASDMVIEAKREVAREIFEEIESVLFHTLIVPTVTAMGIIENKRIDGLHIRIEDYNTIKKKYTGE